MSLKARAALVLVAVAIAAAACAAYLARGVPLQTNLLAMLPPTERDPLVEEVIAKLATSVGARVVFMVSHEDVARAGRAAEASPPGCKRRAACARSSCAWARWIARCRRSSMRRIASVC